MRTIELNFFNTLALACMVFMSILFMCEIGRVHV